MGAEARFWTATPACGWDVSRLARKFIMAGDEPLATFQGRPIVTRPRDDFLASTAFPREVWRLS